MLWVSEELSFIGSGGSSSNYYSISSERYANCLISLTALQSSCASMYMPYIGVFVEATVFSCIFPIQGIHSILTLQILLVSSAKVPAKN